MVFKRPLVQYMFMFLVFEVNLSKFKVGKLNACVVSKHLQYKALFSVPNKILPNVFVMFYVNQNIDTIFKLSSIILCTK